MKITLVILFLFTCYFSTAQRSTNDSSRCGTMKYLEKQKALNPALQPTMQQLEADMQEWIKNNQDYIHSTKAVITIPVVVHVVYNTVAQNISDAQILSQIDVLNKDFRRLNADTINTPVSFKSVAADCEIEFCLAQRTPAGLATNGIVRKQTSILEFTDDDKVKFSSLGGDDAWNRNKYLNIWVCNMVAGSLGYTQFPGGNAYSDGSVINYTNFGRVGNVLSPYDKGRTATHEIGHWLNLYHIWADDKGACTGTDYVTDTPNQADETYDCPAYPQSSCGNTSDMFMNYMDYSDDVCMNIFTQGQKTRMLATLNGVRASILTSDGCLPVGIEENLFIKHLSIYPNPSNGIVTIKASLYNMENITISVHNVIGEVVQAVNKEKNSFVDMQLDLSSEPAGIYYIKIQSPDYNAIRKISIIR